MVGAVVLVVAAIAVAVPRGSDHEDLVLRYESEVWTFPGNPAAAGKILSRHFVRYGPTDETSAAGLGAFGAYNQKVREIFPDLVCRVDGWPCGGKDLTPTGLRRAAARCSGPLASAPPPALGAPRSRLGVVALEVVAALRAESVSALTRS